MRWRRVAVLGGVVLGVLAGLSFAEPKTTSQAERSVRSWSSCRGDASLTGVARSGLPQKLTVRWKYELPDAITSAAAVVDGAVYVGCYDEWFYALDLRDGSVKWKYQAKGPVQSSPLVVGQVVVFGDDDGVVHALDRASGKVKWTFATEGQVISSPNHDAGRIVDQARCFAKQSVPLRFQVAPAPPRGLIRGNLRDRPVGVRISVHRRFRRAVEKRQQGLYSSLSLMGRILKERQSV